MTPIHESIAQPLKLDERAAWKLGDPAALVRTKSGSEYHVHPDGRVDGGAYSGRLSGSVSYPGGPIRPDQIVIGLRIECTRGDYDPFITTRVVSISPAPPSSLSDLGDGGAA